MNKFSLDNNNLVREEKDALIRLNSISIKYKISFERVLSFYNKNEVKKIATQSEIEIVNSVAERDYFYSF